MTCNCRDQINSELATRNTQLSEAIVFGKSAGALMIETEVIEKKRGAKPVVVFPTYCPFCGAALEDSK